MLDELSASEISKLHQWEACTVPEYPEPVSKHLPEKIFYSADTKPMAHVDALLDLSVKQTLKFEPIHQEAPLDLYMPSRRSPRLAEKKTNMANDSRPKENNNNIDKMDTSSAAKVKPHVNITKLATHQCPIYLKQFK